MSAFLLPLLLLFSHFHRGYGYQVKVSETDSNGHQTCSGMWANENTYINTTFSPTSEGQLAMVIYEWKDVQFLGKVTSLSDEGLPQKTYVCTSNSLAAGFCTQEEMGRFIIDLPKGTLLNSTSFWNARVELPANRTDSSRSEPTSNGFWNNPAGNPTPPPGGHPTAWKRDLNPSPPGILKYNSTIHYLVRKTGYYCVAMVPVTVKHNDEDAHAKYQASVFFQNTFAGKLPATDYPKVNFYFAMFLVYSVFALAWGWLCYQHVNELLPIQYYLSGLVGLVVIEMVANWAYYRYLNAHGKGTASTVFLIVVAILDAGRNSMSFFMLLVVSLGLSVVRESLGRTMIKCQALTGAHFIFGILYAVGIVELELESTSAFILLMFVIPLAFTLSGFLLWILYSLNATITQLRVRKQRYKLSMFETLYKILLFTVLIIAIFFVVSTMSFTGRLAEDYSAKSWESRWWLLDGWLALLYLVAFSAIAYLWRPSANNRRLAMSDEIAQDEEDAEDYDLESMGQRGRIADEDDDDTATLVNSRRGPVAEDQVVFEIGDEDAGSDDEEEAKKRRRRLSGEHARGGEDERRGLMNEGREE
ncbi:Integral membrane protein [Mycena indigotica]|uniref:Integral membrane protein n=1 Tax=Mycena indigotica TaxID=2126181 RepID=A0A8H6SYP8_9AGAR|nr:Integral membrane protein [Mycena indigotica]KAF7307076.1 Integral membrane protein [Mycena indigotica]